MGQEIRLGLYSVDPMGGETFTSFDPDSFTLAFAITDPLVALGPDGRLTPALAVSWHRRSACCLEVELRRGVRFHTGEEMTADDVVATIEAHQHPMPTAVGALYGLSRVEKLGPYRLAFHTPGPDAFLLRRLVLLAVYPQSVLTTLGREEVVRRPVGTGAWKLASWDRGREIVLHRNPHHWRNSSSRLEQVRIIILQQRDWVGRLESGELDALINIDTHDVVRAAKVSGVKTRSADAALSHWFMLSNQGPLADVRVRRALNHAVQRSMLQHVAEHGRGRVQTGIATPETLGFDPDVGCYRYSPERAKALLAEAGFGDGLTLRGLVSETSTSLLLNASEFLARVGVTLEPEILPRGKLLQRVIGGNLSGNPYPGDFFLAIVDNLLLDNLFLGQTMLHSYGSFSITKNPGYDRMWEKAASSTLDTEANPVVRRQLERYVFEEALFLFTVQQQAHAAWRGGVHLELPKSGHYDTWFWWTLDAESAPLRPEPSRFTVPSEPDEQALLECTSHTGMFYLPEGTEFTNEWARLVWQRLVGSDQRWLVANKAVVAALVSASRAMDDLSSVLESAVQVAILGVDDEVGIRFGSRGAEALLGCRKPDLTQVLEHPTYADVRAKVDAEGAWLGSVRVRGCDPSTENGFKDLFCAASTAYDAEGARTGMTLVFSDFSDEAERIRNQAVHTIFDNIPYGLLMVGPDGKVRDGYSLACKTLLGREEIEGYPLTELLQLHSDAAEVFVITLEQVFEDSFLPPEVSIQMFSGRMVLGEATLAIEAAPVFSESGEIDAVLFTLTDVSELVGAEAEVSFMMGTLEIMRHKDAFCAFIRDFCGALEELSQSMNQPSWEVEVRRTLHTAKGIFGQFRLDRLQQEIHEVEELQRVSVEHLEHILKSVERELYERREFVSVSVGNEEYYEIPESELLEFQRFAESLSDPQSAEELKRLVRRTRSVPASRLLTPLERLGKRVGRQLNKPVRVESVGINIRIPKDMVRLGEQLGHLVRNAVDHGLERDRTGKDPVGLLHFSIEVLDHAYEVRIGDDGAGIDPDRLAALAVKKGLLTAEEVLSMSADDKQALIFADGFSSAVEVTHNSGVGVGLSSVKAAIEDQGGTVVVESTVGVGTTFILTIPRDLAGQPRGFRGDMSHEPDSARS